MRSLQAVAASALASLAVVGCAGAGGAHLASAAPAARPTSKTASVPQSAQAIRCRARALGLRPGAYVSPMTGEHAVMYALTNRGSVTCTLDGYPQVVLYSTQGVALPFRYTKGGGAYGGIGVRSGGQIPVRSWYRAYRGHHPAHRASSGWRHVRGP